MKITLCLTLAVIMCIMMISSTNATFANREAFCASECKMAPCEATEECIFNGCRCANRKAVGDNSKPIFVTFPAVKKPVVAKKPIVVAKKPIRKRPLPIGLVEWLKQNKLHKKKKGRKCRKCKKRRRPRRRRRSRRRPRRRRRARRRMVIQALARGLNRSYNKINSLSHAVRRLRRIIRKFHRRRRRFPKRRRFPRRKRFPKKRKGKKRKGKKRMTKKRMTKEFPRFFKRRLIARAASDSEIAPVVAVAGRYAARYVAGKVAHKAWNKGKKWLKTKGRKHINKRLDRW